MEQLARIDEDWRRIEETLIGITSDCLGSEHSRRNYGRAIRDFLAWHQAMGRPALRKATLERYKSELVAGGMSPGNVNFRLAALRRMFREAEANGLISEQAARSAAAVEGICSPGRSVGVWLSRGQAEALLNALPRRTLANKRDFAMVCVFLSAGLRRSEMASLTVQHFQQVEGRWAILGIVGKRNRTRDVPITAWAKTAVDDWLAASGIESGIVFRPVNKSDHLSGASMTPEAIRKTLDRVVRQANRAGAGLPEIAAHDLRRTFAQLARTGGAPIEQIQKALGHASIRTTEIYLGGGQDFRRAPCDVLGLEVTR